MCFHRRATCNVRIGNRRPSSKKDHLDIDKFMVLYDFDKAIKSSK